MWGWKFLVQNFFWKATTSFEEFLEELTQAKSDSFSLPYIRNFFLYFSERKRTVLLRVKDSGCKRVERRCIDIWREREACRKHVVATVKCFRFNLSFVSLSKQYHQKDCIFTSNESVTNKETERTNISNARLLTGTKEKKEETKKTSDPETPKSLLGAQSLYKYRPPRVDKVMYQIEVPPMLSLSERKIEHERVMSSVAKDFSNPILVWPGESDVKSEEEESNNLRYVWISFQN